MCALVAKMCLCSCFEVKDGVGLPWFTYIILFNFGWFVYYREKVPVERSLDEVLDMSQFRMLFCTCKIPGVTRDSISHYFKTGKQMLLY